MIGKSTSDRVNHRSLIVAISISSDEYLKWYRGQGKMVSTQDIFGRRVHFPANILQRFVGHSGIKGIFKICFNQDGKFVSIERLAV